MGTLKLCSLLGSFLFFDVLKVRVVLVLVDGTDGHSVDMDMTRDSRNSPAVSINRHTGYTGQIQLKTTTPAVSLPVFRKIWKIPCSFFKCHLPSL